jgi:Family of unknown function (DUF6228)
VESFRIGGTPDDGFLEFFDRVPDDPDQLLQAFSIRVACRGLNAAIQLYAWDVPEWPTALLDEMAERWRSWSGELTWESPYLEARLRCEQDRAGHVSIRVELRTGWADTDWSAAATVQTEAGQLERIARQARAFFGRASGDV